MASHSARQARPFPVDDATRTAARLMHAFAERTGLIGDLPPRRYLWTDAFAVCNFIALGEFELAERLVEQVHQILGRHREDDVRKGWIGGMDEETGAVHPRAAACASASRCPSAAPASRTTPRSNGSATASTSIT